MGRRLLTVCVLGLLGLTASAQGPAAGRSAAEQLRLFEAYRPLLDRLLDEGLRLADAGDALDRADGCRAAAVLVAAALADAAAGPDADPSRVAELSGHLAALVRDGFTPALTQAAEVHRKGSDGYKRLVELRVRAGEDLLKAQAAFRGEGPAGRSPQVAAARAELDAAVQGLPPAGE